MLSGSLYFQCQRVEGFGGQLEDRNSSQGTHEAWATKANSKASLVCSPSLRSAIKWISFERSLCLSYYTMLVLTELQSKQKKKERMKKKKKQTNMPLMLVEPIIKEQHGKFFSDADHQKRYTAQRLQTRSSFCNGVYCLKHFHKCNAILHTSAELTTQFY